MPGQSQAMPGFNNSGRRSGRAFRHADGFPGATGSRTLRRRFENRLGILLSCTNRGTVTDKYHNGVVQLVADMPLHTDDGNSALVVFAYDDIASITYFGKPLQAYWRQRGRTIEEVIAQAFDSYDDILHRCHVFDETLQKEAMKAGGEKYAELLTLALRQTVAAQTGAG